MWVKSTITWNNAISIQPFGKIFKMIIIPITSKVAIVNNSWFLQVYLINSLHYCVNWS